MEIILACQSLGDRITKMSGSIRRDCGWRGLTDMHDMLESLTFTGTVFTDLDVLLHGFTELGGEVRTEDIGVGHLNVGGKGWWQRLRKRIQYAP